MPMPRGLIKATAHYNNIEAWHDWESLAQEAIDSGFGELAEQHRPPIDAGWRKVDNYILSLRRALYTKRLQEFC